MKKINIFLFFSLVPIILLNLLIYNQKLDFTKSFYDINLDNNFEKINNINEYKVNKQLTIKSDKYLEKLKSINLKRNSLVNNIENKIKIIDSNTKETMLVYNFLIDKVLGKPLDIVKNKDYNLKIYRYKYKDVVSYIAILDLKNPDKFQLAVANNGLGSLETTSSMAKSNGAVFAINGGGFNKKNKPLGKTIKNSKIISNNLINEKDFFIAGIDHKGNLQSSLYSELNNLEKFKNGVTFTPPLIINRKKYNSNNNKLLNKHPRTVIGNYYNDNLFFMVVDGRQANYSKGVNLSNLKSMLYDLGLVNAYNLDGGGSSTFYFKDKVFNRPSDGFERGVVNSFILLN
ncbi:MAG: phosphodiester glycosidase family protein [Bacillota bacterium]